MIVKVKEVYRVVTNFFMYKMCVNLCTLVIYTAVTVDSICLLCTVEVPVPYYLLSLWFLLFILLCNADMTL
jgi:hypothetical protein